MDLGKLFLIIIINKNHKSLPPGNSGQSITEISTLYQGKISDARKFWYNKRNTKHWYWYLESGMWDLYVKD